MIYNIYLSFAVDSATCLSKTCGMISCGCCSSNTIKYIPVVRSYRDFESLIMSPTMGAEHFPDQYYHHLHHAKDYFHQLNESPQHQRKLH
jgi:hypothetical protein